MAWLRTAQEHDHQPSLGQIKHMLDKKHHHKINYSVAMDTGLAMMVETAEMIQRHVRGYTEGLGLGSLTKIWYISSLLRL